MALRLTIAILLSLTLHSLPFFNWSQESEVAFTYQKESYLVDILPGGQEKLSKIDQPQKKISEAGHIVTKNSQRPEAVIEAEGSGTGTGDGVGAGEGSGEQTDWMMEKPHYSEESRKNEEEGKVEVVVSCKKDAGCRGTIKKSSGFWRLDQSVLRSVQKIKVSKDEIRELSFIFRLDD